jgi:hypothetical protein
MIKEEKSYRLFKNKFKDILEEYPPKLFIIHHSSLIRINVNIKSYVEKQFFYI